MGSLSKTKRKIPKSINEMSKEMLQETLKKKKECNAKALQTVEKLCEVQVEEEWFLDNLQYINQTHFDDVTIERAITKLCGYPLCSQKLEKIPSQQYHISTRYNKVFDITERKNFCSSTCYKAALFVKNQLFTSPLWFRDQEVIPKYKIMKASKSSMGEEVVMLPDKIKLEPDEPKKNNVDDLLEKCARLSISVSEKNTNQEECKKSLLEKTVEICESVTQALSEKKQWNEIKKPNRNLSENHKTTNQNTDSHIKVENSIFEWFSLDTILFLYGEEKLRKLFSDKAVKIKEALDTKLKLAGCNERIDKMVQLFGLFDSDSVSNSSTKVNLKPLPDYSALREEGKSLEIKVKAFYQGQLVVRPTEEIKEKKMEENNTEKDPIYLPLVDAHAQLALRRKIVLDKLNRVIPDLMKVFNTEYILEISNVRDLVSTFSLAANNITFKPNEWYLVGLILIKLLSLKDESLESILKFESSVNHMSLLLMSFELQKDYLDCFVEKLTDSKTFIKKINEMDI